jgi:predicted glycogen debranching enzyme
MTAPSAPVQTPVEAEWLEPDGLGGFASGTASGIRSRRYHALLLIATAPPSGRMVLVNGLDAWVEDGGEGLTVNGERVFLSRQRYLPDIVAPEKPAELESFSHEPWPTWTYRLPNGTRIAQELIVPAGRPAVALRWRVLSGSRNGVLVVRPFLSGRDFHALHHENSGFRFDAEVGQGMVRWSPYPGVPAVTAVSNGTYAHEPTWYRDFAYAEERARGLDFAEDLAAPGSFRWSLDDGPAVLAFTTEPEVLDWNVDAAAGFSRLAASEQRRRGRFTSPLARAGDAYLVKRGQGKTVIAGYPWFGDWGRDTLIALRGLCLATGRLAEAREILLEWAGQVSEGMLPNRFADQGDAPEFNTVDAALWFVIGVGEYLESGRERTGAGGSGREWEADRARLQAACLAIVSGYARGTRYRIHLDADGLLAAGQPGVQLTWMDAKVGDWVVTPRIGKPVEVQALWLNALRIVSDWDSAWREPYERGLASFGTRFWNDAGYLNDVVDPDHQPGTVDPTFRPNQIFAVGGLPFPLLEGVRARQVVVEVERRLWTPLGLRTLPPDDPRYVRHYQGGVLERDGAYHQGTAWPWLLGPFVEAWVRTNGNDADARRRARRCFFEPLLRHLGEAGLGHISEIADADPPYTPRGCPFQAWSVGEALRLERTILGGEGAADGDSGR